VASYRIADAGTLRKPSSCDQSSVKRELVELLSTPFLLNTRYRRYRFPNVRASQIAAAFCIVGHEAGSLANLLGAYPDVLDARSWLVANVPGVGPKQASMFLRNATGSYNLAVLDRHVIQYIRMIGLFTVTNCDVVKIEKYERCETQLRSHAEYLGYAVGLLDWAIWIVMRTASRIDPQWAS
jgi:N-glycosylase/DNA lyase